MCASGSSVASVDRSILSAVLRRDVAKEIVLREDHGRKGVVEATHVVYEREQRGTSIESALVREHIHRAGGHVRRRSLTPLWANMMEMLKAMLDFALEMDWASTLSCCSELSSGGGPLQGRTNITGVQRTRSCFTVAESTVTTLSKWIGRAGVSEELHRTHGFAQRTKLDEQDVLIVARFGGA